MKRAEALRKLLPFADALRAKGATALYLYGSTSRNKAGADSDLDLFIDYDPRGKFNAFDLVASKRLLQKGLGVDVDLTTRRGCTPLSASALELRPHGFSDAAPISLAPHSRHAREHSGNRKSYRGKNFP